MVLSVHQPTFLPYLGFFRKAAKSDVFVIYDSALYRRGDWHNRNRILGGNGIEWLTLPVTSHTGNDFREASISKKAFLAEKDLKKIMLAYQHAPYFKQYFPTIENIYRSPATSLGEFNWLFIEWLFKEFGLAPTIIRASDIPTLAGKHSTDALVEMALYTKCDIYLSGADGPNYLEVEKFEKNGVMLLINDFHAEPYPQQFGKEFIPNLSVLDALMNIGAEGIKKIIAA